MHAPASTHTLASTNGFGASDECATPTRLVAPRAFIFHSPFFSSFCKKYNVKNVCPLSITLYSSRTSRVFVTRTKRNYRMNNASPLALSLSVPTRRNIACDLNTVKLRFTRSLFQESRITQRIFMPLKLVKPDESLSHCRNEYAIFHFPIISPETTNIF